MKFYRDKFYTQYRYYFGKLEQSQVDGLNFLLDRFEQEQNLTIGQIAYMLASVKHETANTYKPIREKGGWNYFKYLVGRLGIRSLTEANQRNGRGYIQITGLTNDIMFAKRIGVDLVNHPEKALEPEVAFKIMVIGMTEGLFTGKRLGLNTSEATFVRDRQVVNGKDKAQLIAGYATKFLQILEYSIVTQ